MKLVAYATAVTLLTAAAAYAQSSATVGNTGTADSQNSTAIHQSAPSNPQAMSSGNTSGQTKTDAAVGQDMQQNAQMPAGCTTADATCGDARGNPAVQSPTQKKEIPASPQ
ncbi:MAG TPA: hypothetical protein VGL83_05990 [Stellaceae bacterium]